MSNHSPLSDVRTTALAAPTLDIVTPQAIRTLFWRPRFLADEPALDHLPLLFWLTEAVAPACIVDLGCRGVAPTIVKLFLSEHYKYGCHSETGGKQGLGSL